MNLLFTLFPLYLVGNFHCFSMCGPLVMTISRNRFAFFYFLGRISSFSLTGLISGAFGVVLNLFLDQWHLGAILYFVFGFFLILLGINNLFSLNFRSAFLEKKIHRLLMPVHYLILKDKPLALFLFGFFTVFLPCGQTLVVFSTIALSANMWAGLLNGFVFSLMTTPSLVFALKMHTFIKKGRLDFIVGITALIVGALALLKAFADLGVIPHVKFFSESHLIIW